MLTVLATRENELGSPFDGSRRHDGSIGVLRHVEHTGDRFVVAEANKDDRTVPEEAMNKPLAFAALAEAATGIALIVAPSFVARLLLGTELSGVAVAVGRVAGVSLLSLGIACWPSREPMCAARGGMATYGALMTLYLASLGLRGESVGPLLWPAVALHAVLTLLLARAWRVGNVKL